MNLFNELQNLMAKYRFRANRKLSQNFVINEHLIEKIVELADLKASDTVLEIGAGTGFLTKALLKKSKVIAVEKDKGLCKVLEEELSQKNLTLILGDFLKETISKYNKVVSLPPYSQSSAIMHKLLENQFELGVLVFQKEFAEKLIAFPGFEEYCALSVLTQYYFDTEIIQSVSAGSFFPKPKGESAIVVLKQCKEIQKVKNKKNFTFFVKTLFRFRNKNLSNALNKSRQFLLPVLDISSEEFDKRVSSIEMGEEKVDLLPVEYFVEIFNEIA